DTTDFPVESVSWHGAMQFCQKLSERAEERRAGRVYQLPTEAEWEYACRGGARSLFFVGDFISSTQANFDGGFPYKDGARGPYLGRTTKVGSYQPNAYGLFDMHGNVCEWCADWYDEGYYKRSPRQNPQGPESGTLRVMRGGTWCNYARYCSATF